MFFTGTLFNPDKNVAFGIVVVFYGDDKYPFLETDKKAMKAVIAEAVKREMLPNTEAEVFTMSITGDK